MSDSRWYVLSNKEMKQEIIKQLATIIHEISLESIDIDFESLSEKEFLIVVYQMVLTAKYAIFQENAVRSIKFARVKKKTSEPVDNPPKSQ